MWGKKGSAKKKDSKAVASELRRAIAGEALVDRSVKGIDLSTCTTEQLYAIMKIHDINDSDLSKEEKDKQMADVYRMAFGVVPITGMRITGGSGSDIVVERKAPTWFTGNDNIDVTKTNDRIPSWFMEPTEPSEATPKPEASRNPIKRIWDAITGDPGNDVPESTDSSEIPEQAKIKPLNALQTKLVAIEAALEKDLEERNKAKAWNKLQELL